MLPRTQAGWRAHHGTVFIMKKSNSSKRGDGAAGTRGSHAGEVCVAGVVLAAGVAHDGGGGEGVLHHPLPRPLVPPHQPVAAHPQECVPVVQLRPCAPPAPLTAAPCPGEALHGTQCLSAAKGCRGSGTACCPRRAEDGCQESLTKAKYSMQPPR